jgi:hypothetical protein
VISVMAGRIYFKSADDLDRLSVRILGLTSFDPVYLEVLLGSKLYCSALLAIDYCSG